MTKTDGHLFDGLLSRPQGKQRREAYLERVQAELEDLAARVAVVKARIVKQKLSLTLEHHWQLVSVRNRFADFKPRVDELEEASEEKLEEAFGVGLERPSARCGGAFVRAP